MHLNCTDCGIYKMESGKKIYSSSKPLLFHKMNQSLIT